MKEEKKHNHNLTKKLKAILFAVIMVLPILSVIGTILVCTFNENAESTQQSQLNITYKYQTETPQYNETTKTYTLKENYIYQFNNVYTRNTLIDDIYLQPITNESTIYIEDVEGNYYIETNTFSNINYIEIWDTNCYITLDPNDNGAGMDLAANTLIQINGIFKSKEPNQTITIDDENEGNITASTYNEIATATMTTTGIDITNPYKVGKQHAEEMLQFTTGTIAYSGINTMLIGLGITDTFYSKIIAYWLILTAVYIVIDIIIELFTFLTHIINSKE